MRSVMLDARYGMVEAKVVTLDKVPDSARYDCTCTDYQSDYDLYWDNATAYAVKVVQNDFVGKVRSTMCGRMSAKVKRR